MARMTLQEIVAEAQKTGTSVGSHNVQQLAEQYQPPQDTTPEAPVSVDEPAPTIQKPKNLEEYVKLAEEQGLDTSQQTIQSLTEQIGEGVAPQNVVSYQEWEEIKPIVVDPNITLKDVVLKAQDAGLDTSQQTIQAVAEQTKAGVTEVVSKADWDYYKEEANKIGTTPEKMLALKESIDTIKIQKTKLNEQESRLKDYRLESGNYDVVGMVDSGDFTAYEIDEFFGDGTYNKVEWELKKIKGEEHKFNILKNRIDQFKLPEKDADGNDLYDITGVIDAGISRKDVDAFFGDGTFTETKEWLTKHHFKNPVTNEWISKEVIAESQYVKSIDYKKGKVEVDWKRYNTDVALYDFQVEAEKIGLDKTINKYQNASDKNKLNIYELNALTKAKDLKVELALVESVEKELKPFEVRTQSISQEFLTLGDKSPLKKEEFKGPYKEHKVSYDIDSYVYDQKVNKNTSDSDIKKKLKTVGFSDTDADESIEIADKTITLVKDGKSRFEKMGAEEASKYLNRFLTTEEKTNAMIAVADKKDKQKLTELLKDSDRVRIFSYKKDEVMKHYNTLDENQKKRIAEGVVYDTDVSLWNKVKHFVPVYGTYLTVKERGFKSGWTIASAVGDALIFVPMVRGVSVGVKSGQGLGRSVLRETGVALRGELVGPLDLLTTNPKDVFRSITAPFASFKIGSKDIPLASTYRGTYGPMSISKVSAGADPMLVRQAMEDANKAMIGGSKSGKIEIGDNQGTLHYSSAGIQKELKGTVITATPYGDIYKSGVKAEGEGFFVAPSAFLGLEKATSIGKRVYYGFRHGKPLGMLNENFELIDDHKAVLGKVKTSDIITVTKNGKTARYVKNNATILAPNGKKIASVKQQPAFVMIHTNGMQNLPEFAEGIDDIKDLEKTTWKEFSSGEYADDLYPVFKQYKHWIEQEGLLPKDTKIIPVFDKKGNQVILKTRDEVGNIIEMPMMQIVNKDWLKIANATTEEMKPVFDMMKPKMSLNKMLTKVVDVPQKTFVNIKGFKIQGSKQKLADSLEQWLKGNNDVRLVGSTVEYMHTGKHIPNDIDMGSTNAFKSADEMANIIKKDTGIDTKVTKYKDKNGAENAKLEFIDEDGLTREIANIKPLDKSYEGVIIDGVNMESMNSQLSRTLKRMEEGFEGKGFTRFHRLMKSVGKDVDLGIGGKAPTFFQLEKIRLRGWANTVTDIFNKELRLEKRTDLAKWLDENTVKDVETLVTMEKKTDDIVDNIKESTDLLNDVKKSKKLTTDLKGRLRRINLDIEDDPILGRSVAVNSLNKRIKDFSTSKSRSERNIKRQKDRIKRDLDRSEYIERSLTTALSRTVDRTDRLIRKASRNDRNIPRRSERITPRKRVDIPTRERYLSTTRSRDIERIKRQGERNQRKTRGDDGGRIIPRRGKRDEDRGRKTPTRDKDRIKKTTSRRRGKEDPKKTIIKPPKFDQDKKKKIIIPEGSIAWQQGELRGKPHYKVIKPPYKTDEDVFSHLGYPQGAKVVADVDTAFGTLQELHGKVKFDKLKIDMGIMDITLKARKKAKKGKPTISFKRDINQKTKSELSAKEISVSGVK